ncbi:hypothetical protein KFL_001450110 [Klebsormidium nitens]|uniref:Uncharacterized protein n=1 Tax=Klebsormidium nitens TaxID=105231 RepID=A0A1Y1I5G4_KLENI|nr:hypothetical protein KFL_001450110 [Klebsormidium nitens]|eukprot:GAQ83358.1 hypothetical protein KFL_001450110 [Klebsormidium nitens]
MYACPRGLGNQGHPSAQATARVHSSMEFERRVVAVESLLFLGERGAVPASRCRFHALLSPASLKHDEKLFSHTPSPNPGPAEAHLPDATAAVIFHPSWTAHDAHGRLRFGLERETDVSTSSAPACSSTSLASCQPGPRLILQLSRMTLEAETRSLRCPDQAES